jgi:hypothetical protein
VRYLYLLLLASLAACSYTMPITGADENGGTVNLVTRYGEDGALEAANDHCHGYNRVARIVHNDQASNTMTFTCEVPRANEVKEH